MAEMRVTPHEILLPVRQRFIVFTLAAALLANLMPWPGVALAVKPDFVALLVLYWCIEQPRRIGFVVAWLLGMFMDVADGALFGQHALSYSILAYAGIVLHRRVLGFTGTAQVTHVVLLLLMNDLIVLAIRAAAGADFPGFQYFIGSFVAGALWLPMGRLLKLPQRPRLDPDHI